MERILQVNEKPFVTSYSYYAFPLSIISANNRIGEYVARFFINQSSNYELNTMGDIFKDGDSWISKCTNLYLEKCNSCIYRKLEENDYIELQIDFQQYTNSWAAINIFVSDNLDDLLEGDNNFLYRYGNFIYNGINLYKNGEKAIESIPNIDGKAKLLLVRKQDIFEFYIDKKYKELIATDKICIDKNKTYFIGVQVKHGDNMYFRWFFQNFLQLSCDFTNRDRRLEYHYGIKKHWQYNWFNYFLDINTYCYEDVIKLGGIKCLKRWIDRENYIEIKINQKYLQGREEYQIEDHYHQNLIYGYSTKNKVFYLLGYANNGKIEKFKIKFSDLKRDLISGKNSVKKICYHQDANLFTNSVEYTMEMVKEYLLGVNSKEHTQNLVPKDERIYGIKIYDELIKDNSIKIMISDRRVAHLLWEHKKIMLERIKYFQYLGELSEEKGVRLQNEYSKIINLVFDLKNILLKYQLRPDKIDLYYIKNLINNICCIEKQSLNEWLEYWMMKEKRN